VCIVGYRKTADLTPTAKVTTITANGQVGAPGNRDRISAVNALDVVQQIVQIATSKPATALQTANCGVLANAALCGVWPALILVMEIPRENPMTPSAVAVRPLWLQSARIR
jgi:hypothetical protein